MDFFDTNIYIGRYNSGATYKPIVDGEQLIKHMDSVETENALVWHIAQYDYSIQEGNKLLSAQIKDYNRLYGCWSILPPQTGELPPRDVFFKEMKENRIFALRTFPTFHKYLLCRVTFGEFLDEITERKIPLIFSLSKGMTFEHIYGILQEYPEMTCIISDIGDWGSDRFFRPLIEAYSNVYVETSMLSIQDGVIEDNVRKYGSKRFVFGSGFPESSPEASMLQLKYADINESDKKYICSENMKRILSEVQL